jgi:hypothetical protein
VFDYPTPAALAAFLAPKLLAATQGDEPASESDASHSLAAPVGALEANKGASVSRIIAHSGETSAAELGVAGACCASDAIAVVPLTRWDGDRPTISGLVRFGGFIRDPATFDAEVGHDRYLSPPSLLTHAIPS